ncbi:hypothetical protein [Leeuwenhoekiella aequorea]|uniref:hypothetical protein n=1 Tax=Leeuwenhoekiella aequorea TaxID=283736 RepID=UPI000FFF102C|nr:hypothetical protein [Leeuwenhoekiella aequorea]
MRFLVILLSFITLFASVTPCCSDESVCDSESTELCGSASGNDTEKSHLPCSPFFNCGSCSGFIVLNSGSLNLIQYKLVSTKILSINQTIQDTFNSSFFKPPKG